MKLIIEMPNYKFNEVQNGSIASNEILKAVRNGTPITEGDLISRSGVVAFLDNLKFEPNAHWLAEVLQDKKRFPSIGGNQNE